MCFISFYKLYFVPSLESYQIVAKLWIIKQNKAWYFSYSFSCLAWTYAWVVNTLKKEWEGMYMNKIIFEVSFIKLRCRRCEFCWKFRINLDLYQNVNHFILLFLVVRYESIPILIVGQHILMVNDLWLFLCRLSGIHAWVKLFVGFV